MTWTIRAAVLLVCLLGSTATLAGAETPIDIGSRRELFVDRLLIAELKGAQLKLHAPRPAGVVLKPLDGDPLPTVSIVLGWRRGHSSPLVRAFVDLVRQCVGVPKDVPRLTRRRTKS